MVEGGDSPHDARICAIYRKREKERERETTVYAHIHMYTNMHTSDTCIDVYCLDAAHAINCQATNMGAFYMRTTSDAYT